MQDSTPKLSFFFLICTTNFKYYFVHIFIFLNIKQLILNIEY